MRTSASHAIRIVIVDDHEAVRDGLSSLLGGTPGIEVLGSAADGEQAVALVADVAPDVVLMDLSMPRLDGVEATRRIVAAGTCERVLILTASTDPGQLRAALDCGALGCVLKDAAPRELVAGIQAAARRG
jgi:DNA-binding NarL/FixJ family response regulator